MRISVKRNTSGETITLDVEPSDTIETLKAKLHEKIGASALPAIQQIVFEGRLLVSGTLAASGIREGSHLTLVTTVMGMVHLTSGFQNRK